MCCFLCAVFAQSPQVVVQLGHSFAITAISKHPSKPWLATGSANAEIKIWDYNQRKLMITLRGHKDAIKALQFVPGSTNLLLSTSDEDQTLVLWDISQGVKIMVYKHTASFWPEGLGFTAADASGQAGKYFYVGHQFGIEKWETMTGRLIETIKSDSLLNDGKHHNIHNYVYVSSQQISYFSDQGNVYAMNHKTGLFKVIFQSTEYISHLDYNTNQNLLSISNSGSFVILNGSNGKEIFKAKESDNGFSKTAYFSEQGDLIFLSQDQKKSKVINWRTQKDLIYFKGREINQAVFFEKDEYILLTGEMKRPELFNINTLEERPFYAVDNGVKAIAFSLDERYLFKAGNENALRVFDYQLADHSGTLEGHSDELWNIHLSKSNKYIATTSEDQTIKIWDVATRKCIQTIRSPYPINEIASQIVSRAVFKKAVITNDDKYVISYLQGNGATAKKMGYLWKWEIATGKLVNEFQLSHSGLDRGSYSFITDFDINPLVDELTVISYERAIQLRVSDFKVIKKSLDPRLTWFRQAKYSPDGRLLALNIAQGDIDLWDAQKKIKIIEGLRLPPTYIFTMAFNPDGSLLAAAGGFDDNNIYLVDTKTLKVVKTLKGHDAWVQTLWWSKDGKRLYSGAEDSKVILWNFETLAPKVTLINQANSEDYVFYNSMGNYKITRSGFKNVIFKSGTELFPFEQFDIQFNRPDKILESLGSTDAELIELYRNAYQKRLKSVGLTEENLLKGFYLPLVETNPLPYRTTEKELKVTVNASDTLYELKAINIWINEVPVFGKKGFQLSAKDLHNYSLEKILQLNPGRNRIEVSCLNDKGAESMRKVYEVTCEYKFPKPDLYVIVVSVSNYKNPEWNLKYATKDGSDILNAFSSGFLLNPSDKNSERYFNQGYGGRLFDTAVVLERFQKIRKTLEKTKPNDQVIFFFSGHGLLDSKYDFYFASYDNDFNDPAKAGISFDEIESMLDAAPARNKILFIDACHSGDVDKDAIAIADGAQVEGARAGVKSYTTRGSDLLDSSGNRLSFTNSFNLMKELFTGSERGTGTVIISAAAGDSYALESDEWNNGIFTYSILKGLRNYNADANNDKKITVSELKNYIIKEVEIQTAGRQKPTCRKENLEYDFRVK